MANETIQIPTVHLNGTDGDMLRQLWIGQARSVRAAITNLQASAPHARDYYVQGDAAFESARKQHDARITALRSVYRELLAIVDGITDQLDIAAQVKLANEVVDEIIEEERASNKEAK